MHISLLSMIFLLSMFGGIFLLSSTTSGHDGPFLFGQSLLYGTFGRYEIGVSLIRFSRMLLSLLVSFRLIAHIYVKVVFLRILPYRNPFYLFVANGPFLLAE